MKGIVSGGSQQTVDAGAAILRQGGNAVDAVVASVFAAYLGEIMLATPNGGGFALVHAPDRDPELYDFFCATPGVGEDKRGEGMDFAPITVVYESGTSVYHLGRASTAVPGDIAGLAQLLADYGTMPLEAVIQPALRLAREGFILNDYQAYLIRLVDVIFEFDASCLRIFQPEGRWIAPGERYANPWLATTLERLAAEGWQTFYTGELARAMVRDHEARGGLVTLDDLAAYRVIKREPLSFDINGHTIYTNPPPSLGGILIAYGLGLFGRADLTGRTHGDAAHVALLAEIQRQTNTARLRDDPGSLADVRACLDWLTGDQAEADWAAVIAALARRDVRLGPNEPPGHTSTTHISAMDETGLAVGISTTPGETAGYAIGETGILANNMLGEEELSPLGFHQWEPGVRLASMMAPTLVTDSNGWQLVVGSGGAARLRTAIMQLLSNVLDWQMPLDEAVRAARYHFQNDVLDLEAGFDPVAADVLESRGYTLSRWPDRAFYFGGTHVSLRDREGRFSGMGDDRRGGAVAVVE